MYVTIVYVSVKPGCEKAFIDATRENHAASIHEKGNCRFDVLQQSDSPSKFVLYEAYISMQAAVAHKETTHYANWRDTVADWMAEPRQGVVYDGLLPARTDMTT